MSVEPATLNNDILILQVWHALMKQFHPHKTGCARRLPSTIQPSTIDYLRNEMTGKFSLSQNVLHRTSRKPVVLWPPDSSAKRAGFAPELAAHVSEI